MERNPNLPRTARRRQRRLRHGRATILLTLDRRDRPDGYLIRVDDLEHQRDLEGPARAAFAALCAALGATA